MADTELSYDGVPVSQLFTDEKPGWRGYVEWEEYPEKKRIAAELMKGAKLTPPPEFQFAPLPTTNPVLVGHRWKEEHELLGLKRIVDYSWETVQREKENMIHLLDFPYNGETRHEDLTTKLTDNKHHFVRNHGGVPDIDEDAFVLEIGGLVNNPVKLKLSDLKDPAKFPQAEVTVTLQCSGTRRIEQINEYPGEGDELINAPWGEGAIGTAVYRGVPLKKVLKLACGGVQPGCEHLEFIGADTYFKKGHLFNYAVSAPYRKVRANRGEEVLLAWEMNGQPLPKIHGAPLRVVVTGYIGARSTKWVYRINALPVPSYGPVQRQEYLYFTSQIGKQNAKYSNGFPIGQMPVSSAILKPLTKTVVIHDGKISLSGWAYSGGGNWVERVEVSPDGGHVWYQVPPENLTEKHYHAWRLWHIEVPVDAEGWLEFCVRTWDASCNTEPTYVRSAWNWDLHVTSSAHRIKIYSVNRTRAATRERLALIQEHGMQFEPITLPLPFALEDKEAYDEAVTKSPREPRS